jgi:solute carrier family 25 (mitochondrial S-adenosylmethionine transporter), member 26
MFEHLKAYFLDRRKRRKTQQGREGEVDGIFERARITALSAALAGTGAAWITTPIDVLKTRIMLAAGDEAKNKEAHSPHTLANNNNGGGGGSEATSPTKGRQTAIELTKQILKNEGIRGMFRGALLRSLWTAFGSGLYLGCYEGGRHYLEERRRDQDAGGGDVLMEKERDWKGVKVGVGASRSQGEKVRKSAWQDE